MAGPRGGHTGRCGRLTPAARSDLGGVRQACVPVIGRRCILRLGPLRLHGARGEVWPAPGRAVTGRRWSAPRGTGEVTSELRAECVYDSLVYSRAVRLWRTHQG